MPDTATHPTSTGTAPARPTTTDPATNTETATNTDTELGIWAATDVDRGSDAVPAAADSTPTVEVTAPSTAPSRKRRRPDAEAVTDARTATSRRSVTGRTPQPASDSSESSAPTSSIAVNRSGEPTPHDRVWAVLCAGPGSTAAELSAVSGVARSSVAKLLAGWSDTGRATSTPGATSRAARLWTATATPAELTPDTTTDTGIADRSGTDSGDGAGGESTTAATGTTTLTTPAPREKTRHGHPATAERATNTAAANPAVSNPAVPGGAASSGAGSGGVAPTALRAGATRVTRSGKTRLVSGALAGMVQDFLAEHPGEHGPTGIGRVLGHSSGAIANALERLVTTGWAERSNDRPRRYRSADQPDNLGTGITDADASVSIDSVAAAGGAPVPIGRRASSRHRRTDSPQRR